MLAGLKSKFLSVNFFDLLIVFLASTSFIGLVALVLGIFNPMVCFFLGFLFLFFIFYFFSDLFISNKPFIFLSPNTFWVALLLVLAFLVRQDPFPYIMGNQDQGLYVNMSSYFQREGHVEIQDSTRNLIKDPKILSIYDANKQNNLELGIYKTSTPENYTFQFYHLFPIWMSIVGELFGDINRYYALTFFSLVSILAAYLLILEITKSYFWGVFGGILLALNPLHAFFSRWPVTEIPTLCFSLCGFYYLAKFFNLYQSDEKDSLALNLALSVLCFGLLFFTRISGFMYVPVFLIILFFAPFSKDRVFSKYLIIYAVSVLVFLSISVWYGLTYSQPYSLAIYEASFSKILGQKWQQPLFFLLITTGIFFIFWIKFSWDNLEVKNWFFNHRLDVINFVWWLMSLISILALLLGVYKAYLLGFTDRYADDPWVGQRWHLWGQGWQSIGYVSLVVAVMYISPILFLALFAVSWVLKRSIFGIFVWFFFVIFLTYICLLQWNIPHQYYYARYLLSEVVPYGIICVVIGLSLISYARWRKVLVGFVMLTTLPYYVYYLLPQFKGQEGISQYIALNEILKGVNKNDLIIFDGNDSRVTTPLIYYFDRNIFPISDAREFIEVAKWATKNTALNKVFFMTKNIYKENFLSPIKTVEYKENIFETVGRIPVNFITSKRYDIYLFGVNEDILKVNNTDLFSIFFNIGNAFFVKIEGFYSDRVWTKSNFKIYLYNVDLSKAETMNLLTYGYIHKAVNINENSVKLTLNSIPVNLLEKKNDQIIFSLPDQLRAKQNQVIIEGQVSTWVPKKLGINQDARELGLDVKAIEFK